MILNAVKKIFRSRRKRSELKKSLFQVGQVFKDFGSTFLGLQRRVSAGRWAEGLRESSLGVWGRQVRDACSSSEYQTPEDARKEQLPGSKVGVCCVGAGWVGWGTTKLVLSFAI